MQIVVIRISCYLIKHWFYYGDIIKKVQAIVDLNLQNMK